MATRTYDIGVDKGLLDRSIFVDQDIYQQELEQIFTRMWLWIGHESLVPSPNDFFTTYMGEDPVILTRDAKGELHAMLNMCRHRGNRVVRADDGNAKNFMCTYHGWTYSSDGGKLVSVPGLQEAYYGELDVEHLGLIEVAQLDTYAGFIFATWDPEAPSLEEYLGDFRWYLDSWFNRRTGGLELIGPLKWVIPTNWKMPSDNFSGDGYHGAISHRSANMAYGKVVNVPPAETRFARPGAFSITVNGHGGQFTISNPEQVALRVPSNSIFASPSIQEYRESIQPEMEHRLGPTRLHKVSTSSVYNLFPNTALHHGASAVRMWHPRGPFKTEVWSFVAYDKAASEETKDTHRRQSIKSFGPNGMYEQDDMDNWNQCVAAGKSLIARKYWQNLSMGLGRETHSEVAPGTIAPSMTEHPQRGFYRWWQQVMESSSWKEISIAPQTAKYEGTATFKG